MAVISEHKDAFWHIATPQHLYFCLFLCQQKK